MEQMEGNGQYGQSDGNPNNGKKLNFKFIVNENEI